MLSVAQMRRELHSALYAQRQGLQKDLQGRLQYLFSENKKNIQQFSSKTITNLKSGHLPAGVSRFMAV